MALVAFICWFMIYLLVLRNLPETPKLFLNAIVAGILGSIIGTVSKKCNDNSCDGLIGSL